MTPAVVSSLTSLPFAQLRRSRYFYFWYDLFYLVLSAAALAVMALTGHRPLIETWTAYHWLLLPVICHLQILCSVVIHQATHGSFSKHLNRLIGEACGVVVLTRFASWEVVHRRHHKYSDDVEKDPHPIDPNYFRYCWKTILNVERQLQNTYFELYGDNPETRRYEKRRAWMSYVTNIVLIAAWYQFLGFYAFFLLFVPASIVGFFHLVHFNWSTHNAQSSSKDWRPVNLDHGYYWIGNRIWFGIYMHANHHRRSATFNPRYVEPSLPIERPV